MHGNRVCSHCLGYFNVEECRLKVIRGELYTICPYCDETIKKLKNFPPEERERLLRREHDFDHDLRNLFRKDKIEDINDVYLRTNDAKDYLHNIFEGGEAEDSLDSFLFQKDPFIKKLQKIKKAGGEKGKPDYTIEKDFISLELKPLFVKDKRRGILKQEQLDGDRLKSELKKQIYKYIGQTKYVILTNYKKWLFFSTKSCISEENCKPFYECEFFGFLNELKNFGDLREFLEKKQEVFEKEDLDERFFKNLKEWKRILGDIKFECSEREKDEIIINLINKLVFVEVLDDFMLIEPLWIKRKWEEYKSRGRNILDFLNFLDKYFYDVYGTELFKGGEIKINAERENIIEFEKKLEIVLGLKSKMERDYRGITQYYYRNIDEDISGKSYERYLAEHRKEKGIFYTPKNITKYIVNNTVGCILDEILNEIKAEFERLGEIKRKEEEIRDKEESLREKRKKREQIRKWRDVRRASHERKKIEEEIKNLQREINVLKEEYNKIYGEKERHIKRLKELLEKFVSVKVLDPACGSASFLIKALRVFWDKYNNLKSIFEENKQIITWERSLGDFIQRLHIDYHIRTDSKRRIFHILLRHIYGNDIDERALDIAKGNLWRESIKLSPEDFRYEKRKDEKLAHVLPDLELNFGNGDALVGLPEDLAVRYLEQNYKEEIKELFKLREKYLETGEIAIIDKIREIKGRLRRELDKEFEKYLEREGLPSCKGLTRPLHWVLEFWHAFFDRNGDALPVEERGFHVILGNPPYGRIKQVLSKEEREIFSRIYEHFYKYQRGNFNFYKLFLEKCFYLLKKGGRFSMIFPSSFLSERDSEPLRKLIFEETIVDKILQFPEKTRVFTESTQDVTVLIYEKRKLDDYEVQIKTNIDEYDMDRLNELEFLRLKKSEMKELNESYQIPALRYPEYEWRILKKISKFPTFGLGVERKKTREFCVSCGQRTIHELVKEKNGKYKVCKKCGRKIQPVGEIGVGHLDETLDKEFMSKERTGDLLVKGIHLDRYFVNLDEDGPQPRYVRKQDFLRKKPEAKKSIEMERIIGRNVVNKALRPRLRFSILPKGFVITNNVKYIIPNPNANLDKYFIVGLLNSSLLNWRFEIFSNQNGIRNYEIEALPIIRASQEEQAAVSELVKKMLMLMKLRHKFLKIWRKNANNLRDAKKSLKEILLEDKRKIKAGNSENVWTKDASIYPDSKDKEIIEKQFSRIKIIGVGKNKLKICGIEGAKEEKLLELSAKNEMLRDILYLEITELLSSGKKLKCLRDIFSKTEISVIEPNVLENTPNLLKKTMEEFKEWVKNEGLEYPLERIESIVSIDNEIESVDAEIDAYVFKLYGLSKEEVDVVLDALETSESIKGKILDKYEALAF